MADAHAPNLAEPTDWRRTHPLGVVLNATRNLPQLVIGLFVLGEPRDGLFNSVIEVVVLALAVGGSLARWLVTRYAVTDDAVHFRTGIIMRQRQVLARTRIQNVTTSSSIVARLFSLTELVVSDASESGEIAVPAISYAEAERLSTLLRPSLAQTSGQTGHTSGTVDVAGGAAEDGTASIDSTVSIDSTAGDGRAASGLADGRPDGQPADGSTSPPLSAMAAPTGLPATEPTLLYETTLRRLLTTVTTADSSVYSALTIVTLIVLGVLTYLFPSPLVRSLLDSVDLALPAIPDLTTAGLIMAVTIVGPIAGALFRPITETIRLGGFKLSATPDRLHLQAGLTTQAKLTARRERVQQIRVGKGMIHRRLGIETLSFQTADTSNNLLNSRRGFIYLAPTLPTGTWLDVTHRSQVFPRVELSTDDLNSVSPKLVRRRRIRMGVQTLIVIVLVGALSLVAAAVMAAAGVVSVVVLPPKRYRMTGWAISDDQFMARTGMLSEDVRLALLDKVQVVKTTANLFQRRLRLADLVLITAGEGTGGMIVVPDLDRHVAHELAETVARRAATTPFTAIL